MPLLRFEQSRLTAELEQLPATFRTILALSAAERLLPMFGLYARRVLREGDFARLQAMVADLWTELRAGTAKAREHYEAELERCLSLRPVESPVYWVPEQAYAEETVSAVADALRAQMTGKAAEALSAARRVYQALCHFIVERDAIDLSKKGESEKVIADPLMQAELERQVTEIQELQRAAVENVADTAAAFQRRAAGARLFGEA